MEFSNVSIKNAYVRAHAGMHVISPDVRHLTEFITLFTSFLALT